MRVTTVIIAAVLGLSCAGAASAQGTGRSLDIQPGARENGMGGAGVALPGDPSNAVWWNPAALGFAEWYSGQWTFAQLVPGLADDIRYQHFTATMPIKGFGGAGLGLTYLSYGKSEGTDEFGNSTGSYTPYELTPSLSAAYRPVSELAVGMTAKYFRIKLGPTSGTGTASTVAFDVGGLYRQEMSGATLGLGVNLQNLGPEVTFKNEDQSSPLGRNFKMGGAFTVPVPLGTDGYEIGGTVAADYNQSLVTNDFKTSHVGIEAYGAYARWVRVMYRYGRYVDDLGDINGSTHGVGVRLAGATFDIAWIPQSSGLDKKMKKFTVGFNSDALLLWAR